MTQRAGDWFKQALRDPEQSMACSAARQAAEKAVKALHLHVGQEAWEHMVARLLQELPESLQVPQELVEKGKVLDNFYVPSRYPNGHPEGAPFEHYGPLRSKMAVDYASEIIEFVHSQMA
ncbi:MAG: HEPN domain-containing protein [Caldiserica bacterium]|jgi:HEPN domain-containing protein|nr:HEPN domain-containing protein [Caldisericota bacterium]